MTDACVVMTTTDSAGEADRLATLLVDRRLAACVQVIPMTSHYRWEDKVQHSAEQLLLIKTTDDRYDDIAALVAAEHSYDVPELIKVAVTGGAAPYLDWLSRETRRTP
jgi:periplasmic divalent cation tolerance protein